MKLIAVAIIAVLTIGAFAQTEDEAVETLKKIESSKFGRTILDTIQLQMEAGDPVSDLIHLLQGIEEGLSAEQKEDDTYIENAQVECDDTLARLQEEIAAAEKRIKDLQEELDEKIPRRDQKVQIVGEKQEFKAMIEEKITQMDQSKILKDQEWAEEQSQHDSVQYDIERAKQIFVDQLKGGNVRKGSNAFAQVSEHLSSSLKKTNYKKKSWNSIIQLLVQITAAAPVQADQSAVDRVIEICDLILDKIAESREFERKDYQHWMSEYRTARDTLSDKANEIQSDINQLESEIATLNKRIQGAQDEMAEQKVRITEKGQQYNDKLQFCDDENISYTKRREQRDDDRVVVSQTIGLLNAQIRTFRQYVNKRTQSVTRAN